MKPTRQVDVVVLGGGASGLMCAFTAGERGRSVVVLDHRPRLGEKIAISGGGRCNFTHVQSSAQHYLSANPAFAISALARYTPQHIIALLQQHGIGYQDKGGGQLFCSGSARQVVNMLLSRCQQAGVLLHHPCQITEVLRHGEGFRVVCQEITYQCQSLVVASGGLSLPKLGASDVGLRLARSLGLTLQPTRPGLVPLIFDRWSASLAPLSGISLEAEAGCQNHRYTGGLLFTHRGLSGPAILQISSHWLPGQPIVINLLPGRDMVAELKTARQEGREVVATLAQHLPRRLASVLAQGYPSRLGELNDTRLITLARTLQNWHLIPSGHQGYGKAEVTVGGVDTRQLSSKTMACLTLPQLLFVGEVMDVTGELGGYNLQWAWSSGHVAGSFA